MAMLRSRLEGVLERLGSAVGARQVVEQWSSGTTDNSIEQRTKYINDIPYNTKQDD